MDSKWGITIPTYKWGIPWGCNPFTNHLVTSWDIQVVLGGSSPILQVVRFTPIFFSHKVHRFLEVDGNPAFV